jgi:signal peptidase I
MTAWLTRVLGGSMMPALRPGQLALTRALPRGASVRRGDVVVAEPRGLGRRVVKRVVGLPGERVTVRGGAVTVDGVLLDEPYASPSYFRGRFDVPAGHYLLLGDRRDASDDARTWEQPYVPREALVGRLVSGSRRYGLQRLAAQVGGRQSDRVLHGAAHRHGRAEA